MIVILARAKTTVHYTSSAQKVYIITAYTRALGSKCCARVQDLIINRTSTVLTWDSVLAISRDIWMSLLIGQNT
jgi:hypothetical protein